MHAVALCRSADLVEGGLAVPFDVVYGGQSISMATWAQRLR